MKAETARKLRFWYGVFLGVLTVAVGITFIVVAADIYYADPDGTPYSYSVISKKLAALLAPLIIWIVAVIAGYVLSVLFPMAEKKRKTSDNRAALKRLRVRMPKGESEEFLAERKRFKMFEITHIVIWSVCAVFAVLAAVMSIVYLADVKHFPAAAENLTGEMLGMLKNVLPWVGSAFILFIGAIVYEGFSAKRELASMKKLLVLGANYPVEEPLPFLVKTKSVIKALESPVSILIIRIAVAALAVGFIIAGILNGGMGAVLKKAINICTECVGLG